MFMFYVVIVILYVLLCWHVRRNEDTQYTLSHPFNGPLFRTIRVSRYKKGKTNLDFTEARDSEWQWHQLVHMQVCTSLQTDNHASTLPLKFFTGRMPFLPLNQQRQSTEGIYNKWTKNFDKRQHRIHGRPHVGANAVI